jgi:hypothetical protein
VSQQLAALTNAHFDPTKLLDRNFLNKFINQFLANAGLQQSSSSSDPLAALIQPVGDGTNIPDLSIPPAGFNLSFLNGKSGGGSILNLFA